MLTGRCPPTAALWGREDIAEVVVDVDDEGGCDDDVGISCSVSKGTFMELLNMVLMESTLEFRLLASVVVGESNVFTTPPEEVVEDKFGSC